MPDPMTREELQDICTCLVMHRLGDSEAVRGHCLRLLAEVEWLQAQWKEARRLLTVHPMDMNLDQWYKERSALLKEAFDA